MSSTFEFNRLTVALPVETFKVDAYIALDERLPVVTEFVLRLLRICGAVNLAAFRNYFGFTDNEALAIIDSLSRQGLVELLEERLQLTRFAVERFNESGGEHPRFSKVELRSETVMFDLVSFTPLRAVHGEMPTDNVLKLDAPDEALGHSVERARTSFRERYPEIASMRSELRDRSFGVYSVEDIESKRRNYLPIPVSFSLDDAGQVSRQMDEAFERSAPSDLVQYVNEQVTAVIPKTIALGSAALDEFIDTFELQALRQYVVGKRFDLLAYLTDVHFAQSVKFPEGVESVFGNLYMPDNQHRIVKLIESHRKSRRGSESLKTSLAWLAPDYHLWGRGDLFAQTVKAIAEVFHGEPSDDELFLLAPVELGQEQQATGRFRVRGLKEVHFYKPSSTDGAQHFDGRLELMLYPTGFMVAMIHLSPPGNSGLWLPIGFASSLPKHMDAAKKTLKAVSGGRRYGGRARLSQKDTRRVPSSFEEGLPFLNYSTVTLNSSKT